MPSPLERMIDANMACTKCGIKGIGNCHGWEKKPSRKELVKAEVDRVASDIIGHIDRMYSGMWAGCAKNCEEKPAGQHDQPNHVASSRIWREITSTVMAA